MFTLGGPPHFSSVFLTITFGPRYPRCLTCPLFSHREVPFEKCALFSHREGALCKHARKLNEGENRGKKVVSKSARDFYRIGPRPPETPSLCNDARGTSALRGKRSNVRGDEGILFTIWKKVVQYWVFPIIARGFIVSTQ